MWPTAAEFIKHILLCVVCFGPIYRVPTEGYSSAVGARPPLDRARAAILPFHLSGKTLTITRVPETTISNAFALLPFSGP